jgi:hypothetical protein
MRYFELLPTCNTGTNVIFGNNASYMKKFLPSFIGVLIVLDLAAQTKNPPKEFQINWDR